mgnify:CR=1 FL=1
MPGGEKQSVQTSTTQPYKGSVKSIDQVLKDAYSTYQNGPQVYTGSTVIPFSNQTVQAQKGLMGLANQNTGKNGLNNNLQGIINKGGYSDPQQQAVKSMQGQLKGLGSDGLSKSQGDVASQLGQSFSNLGNNGLTGSQDMVIGGLRDQFGQLGKDGLSGAQNRVLAQYQNRLQSLGGNGLTNVQDKALQNFQRAANGPYDATKSGFQDVLNNSLRDAEDQVSLGAAAAGRYGSGAHQSAVARQTGNIAANMRTSDFYNWQNRADAANQAAANLSQSGLGNVQSFGNQISGLSGTGLNQQQQLGNQISNLANTGLGQQQQLGGSLANLSQTGVQNRQNLSNNLFNAGQSGLGNMITAYQGQLNPYQTMAGVGSQMEDLATRQKNDELRLFNDTQNAPWNLYQQMLGVANLGGAYNNQATTTTAPSQNPFLTGLGVASSGVGLLGGLGLI